MQKPSPIPRRASRDIPANPHHSGFSAGLHDGSQPYMPDEFEVDAGDFAEPPRLPTSTRRYTDTRGNHVIQRGNQQLVGHYDTPPPRYKKRRHVSPVLYIGLAMFVMVGGYWIVSIIGQWVANEVNNFNYGMPRTYQCDAVVGHNDSTLHPSHFIALNLNGQIEVIEIQGGNPKNEKVYIGPGIFSPNPQLAPVTISFQDVNDDGKPDMLLHLNGQTIIYLNDGKTFQTPKQ